MYLYPLFLRSTNHNSVIISGGLFLGFKLAFISNYWNLHYYGYSDRNDTEIIALAYIVHHHCIRVYGNATQCFCEPRIRHFSTVQLWYHGYCMLLYFCVTYHNRHISRLPFTVSKVARVLFPSPYIVHHELLLLFDHMIAF